MKANVQAVISKGIKNNTVIQRILWVASKTNKSIVNLLFYQVAFFNNYHFSFWRF